MPGHSDRLQLKMFLIRNSIPFFVSKRLGLDVKRRVCACVCVRHQCSEVCGGGEQQRIVKCLEDDRCDPDLQPSSIQSCNDHLCVQWLTGSWGQVHTHTRTRCSILKEINRTFENDHFDTV